MVDPVSIVFYLLALIIAITIHEFSHALVADHLGDPTPRLQGRVTLNPLAHLDPLGTLMLFIAHFGWGKPVQFDPFNLRSPRHDAALISFAGPASNLIIAIIGSIFVRILLTFFISLQSVLPQNLLVNLIHFFTTLISINVVLAVFNLVPVHPLDGFKIVGGFLSPAQAKEWYSLERYGIIFLIFLIFPLFGRTAPITYIINPLLEFFFKLLLPTSSGFA